jgi:acetyltransferase-like isoleucine patch superfamily enzyme
MSGLRHRAHTARDGLVFLLLRVAGLLPSHLLRRAAYRMFGMRLERGAHVYAGAEIRAASGIAIGKRSSVGTRATLDGRGGLEIGANVNLSSEVAIWTMQHRVQDPDFGVESAPVRIGDRAWISFRATILPGVTIGEGAVVAAGAVATRDVAPFEIVAGVPAQVIGTRERGLRYELDPPPPFL